MIAPPACSDLRFLLAFSAVRRCFIDSSAIEPGKDFSSAGPTLPAEMSKAPYRPKVVGTIAFFFGPMAGAIVSVINLRRFGYPLKAKQVFLWSLAATAGLAVVLMLTPDVLARGIGIGAEIAFYKVYSSLQEKEFAAWRTANPQIEPLNGWRAMGWGFAGLTLFLLVFFVVAFPLTILFPSLT